MSRPELAQLINDKVGVLFEDPVTTALDDAAFRSVGDRLGAVDAMIAKRDLTRPGQHGHGQFVAGQFFRLLSHLRNVAVVIEAAAKGARLSHLHDVVLNFFLGEGVRVVGKVPEEMAKVLLFTSFDQEPGDIHVHVHGEVPIRDTRVREPG